MIAFFIGIGFVLLALGLSIFIVEWLLIRQVPKDLEDLDDQQDL